MNGNILLNIIYYQKMVDYLMLMDLKKMKIKENIFCRLEEKCQKILMYRKKFIVFG